MEARSGDLNPAAKAAVPRAGPMPALAETLEAVAAEGRTSSTKDGSAGRSPTTSGALGGILSRDDMAGYRALVVKPVQVEVRGLHPGGPPAGLGGLTSLQMIALFDSARTAR